MFYNQYELLLQTNGTSNGLLPMLRVYNNTARYVDQGGNKASLSSIKVEGTLLYPLVYWPIKSLCIKSSLVGQRQTVAIQ